MGNYESYLLRCESLKRRGFVCPLNGKACFRELKCYERIVDDPNVSEGFITFCSRLYGFEEFIVDWDNIDWEELRRIGRVRGWL